MFELTVPDPYQIRMAEFPSSMLIGRTSFAEFVLLILTKAFNAKVANFVHFKNLKRLEGSFVSEQPVFATKSTHSVF